MNEQTEWPETLKIRDTKLHDDLGGMGQRIFTTAGQGYKKETYHHNRVVSALQAERDAALEKITDYELNEIADNKLMAVIRRQRNEAQAEAARLRKWVEQRGCGPDCDVNYATDQWHCVCGRRQALESKR